MEFEDSDKFEVSFEYDEDGYIYEVTIEKYENNERKEMLSIQVSELKGNLDDVTVPEL